MHPNRPIEEVPGQPGMRAMPSEKSAENMLRCFISPDRACGPDCMAFTTTTPSGNDYRDQAWPHCLVLTNIHRAGKHLIILAESVTKVLGRFDPQKAAPPPDLR